MKKQRTALHLILADHLPPRAGILIAVSGGIDSVALLHACSRIIRLGGYRFEIAHIDHSLRQTSARDREFVAELARTYDLPFHTKILTPPAPGTNVENWGRRERYSFFKSILAERSLDWIVTAHHADDVAETFLMRIISNKEPRSILARDPVRRCIRPWLQVTREQIERYSRKNGLRSVEDETNLDTRYLRNRVRQDLLPMLREKFQPHATEILSKRALALADDLEALEGLASELVSGIDRFEWGSREWIKELRARLRQAPDALAWRAIEHVFRERVQIRLGRAKALELAKVIRGEITATELPGGLEIRRSGGKLRSALSNEVCNRPVEH